ncbi:diguanylate cyclase [Caldichromatium japonicum]|uniref:diguanylate cyclase n=1 Tax=Caldichromatium japonicum TaxID=2699430 RepID=A0A6G7VCW2_9GAMM|nr:diguanylate cyclase [Caldichromatium japonicum]QIK37913.1 diguanylate cyclase [Caldichromatium japonicum]
MNAKRRSSLRACQGDIAGRFGGEEFLVILPDTELDAAAAITERLCALVSHSPHAREGRNPETSVAWERAGSMARIDHYP